MTRFNVQGSSLAVDVSGHSVDALPRPGSLSPAARLAARRPRAPELPVLALLGGTRPHLRAAPHVASLLAGVAVHAQPGPSLLASAAPDWAHVPFAPHRPHWAGLLEWYEFCYLW